MEELDIVRVSDVLNNEGPHNRKGTGAYNKIGEALGIEIDCNSEIFHDIEEFIVMKFREMQEESES